MAFFIDITSSLLPHGTRLGTLHIERALTLHLLRHGRGEIRLCFVHPVSQKFHEIHRPVADRILSGELHAEASDLASLPPRHAPPCRAQIDALRNDVASTLDAGRALARLKARTTSFSAQDILRLRQDLTPSPLKGDGQNLLIEFSAGEAPLSPDDALVTIGANARQVDMRRIRQHKERAGFRYIAAIHNFDPLGAPHLVPHSRLHEERAHLGELIWTADQFICFSKAMQNNIQQYLNDWKIHRNISVVSPLYGHPTQSSRNDSSLNINLKRFFLHVSDLDRCSNHSVIMAAFEKAILSATIPQDLLYICVYNENSFGEELFHSVQENGVLKDRVIFIENKSDMDLSNMYKLAKFIVEPSKSGAYSFNILSSINFNKPCISSRTEEFMEIGQSHFRYADPDNYTEWKRHIEDLSVENFAHNHEIYSAAGSSFNEVINSGINPLLEIVEQYAS